MMERRSLARQFAPTLSAHVSDGFAALFAKEYINHQTGAAAPLPAAGVTPKQGSVAFFAARLKGIPDLKVAIEVPVAQAKLAPCTLWVNGTRPAMSC
jgi:hypothetical protein